MYIYVDLSFQQQPEDIVVFNNATIAKVKTDTPDLYQFWQIEDDELINAFENEMQAHYEKLTENYIYNHYSQQKQAQDQASISRCTTKLKASHVQDVELLIMKASNDILLENKTLDEAFITASESIADELKPTLLKLIKCSVRSEWVQLVLDESELAFLENRTATNYPEFPQL